MGFRLVPKSLTLNDLERRNGPYFALLHRIWKPAFQLITASSIIEFIDQKSEVGFYNTLTGEVSVRN